MAPGRCCPRASARLLKGFVLNKFRGDAALLAPGAADAAGADRQCRRWRRCRCGGSTACRKKTACLMTHVAWRTRPGASPGAASKHDASAVIAFPRISNLDEFQPLNNIPGVRLIWVRTPAELAGLRPRLDHPARLQSTPAATWPGCAPKGWTAAMAAHAGRGGAVLGICGGLQMLGEALIDPHGDRRQCARASGLLPLVTLFELDKNVADTGQRVRRPGRFRRRALRARGAGGADCKGSVSGAMTASGFPTHWGHFGAFPASDGHKAL